MEGQCIRGARHEGNTFTEWELLSRGLLFCAVVTILDFLFIFLDSRDYLSFLDSATAKMAAIMMRFIGHTATIVGDQIFLTNGVSITTTDCSAIFLMIVFASFIFVYPSSWKAKAAALIAGLPSLFGLGVFRLSVIAITGDPGSLSLPLCDDFTWQIIFMIFVVFLGRLWIGKAVKATPFCSKAVAQSPLPHISHRRKYV
jgi:exosortase/archaeosortase family protein